MVRRVMGGLGGGRWGREEAGAVGGERGERRCGECEV